MIGFLQGQVRGQQLDGAYLILTPSGVGYVVASPDEFKTGEEVEVHAVTIVREDAINLFAFKEESNAQIFKRLIRINGVGPQVALNLIRDLGAAKTILSISSGDTGALTTVAGVGPALAKKVVASANLPKEFVAQFAGSAEEQPFQELATALVDLGYTLEEVNGALVGIDPEATDNEAMKIALSNLRGTA